MPNNKFNITDTAKGAWRDAPCEDCDGVDQPVMNVLDADLNPCRRFWFADQHDAWCAQCRADWERIKRIEHIYTERYLQRLDEENV